MAMRKTREIDTILTNAQIDPRLKTIILEMAERMNVQHQQIMQLAEHQGTLIDRYQDIVDKMGGLGHKLDKLGITDTVKKMEAQDDEPDNTHIDSRRKH